VTFSYDTSYHNGTNEFVSGDSTTVDHNIAVGDGRLHTSQGTFIDNSWDRTGDVAFESTDPDAPNFLRPSQDCGFADIGAYAAPSN